MDWLIIGVLLLLVAIALGIFGYIVFKYDYISKSKKLALTKRTKIQLAERKRLDDELRASIQGIIAGRERFESIKQNILAELSKQHNEANIEVTIGNIDSADKLMSSAESIIKDPNAADKPIIYVNPIVTDDSNSIRNLTDKATEKSNKHMEQGNTAQIKQEVQGNVSYISKKLLNLGNNHKLDKRKFENYLDEIDKSDDLADEIMSQLAIALTDLSNDQNELDKLLSNHDKALAKGMEK